MDGINKKIEENDRHNLVLINSNRPFEKMEEMVDIYHNKSISNEYLRKRYITEPL